MAHLAGRGPLSETASGVPSWGRFFQGKSLVYGPKDYSLAENVGKLRRGAVHGAGFAIGVCTENLSPDVVVMKSAKDCV
jgi:hypothetical protein